LTTFHVINDDQLLIGNTCYELKWPWSQQKEEQPRATKKPKTKNFSESSSNVTIKEVWRRRINCHCMAIHATNDQIYIVKDPYNVCCISKKTGKTIWRYHSDNWLQNLNGKTIFACADGLYLYTMKTGDESNPYYSASKGTSIDSNEFMDWINKTDEFDRLDSDDEEMEIIQREEDAEEGESSSDNDPFQIEIEGEEAQEMENFLQFQHEMGNQESSSIGQPVDAAISWLERLSSIKPREFEYKQLLVVLDLNTGKKIHEFTIGVLPNDAVVDPKGGLYITAFHQGVVAYK